MPAPLGPTHSATAVLETRLSCCGHPNLKNLAGQKSAAIHAFRGAPLRFSRLSAKHTHRFAVALENRRVLSSRAGYVARHALSCAVGAASCAYTRTAQGFALCLYSGELFAVWYCTPTKFG